ncbi:MAG: rod shape-determining protein RodA [Clostridiales bacterium]|nr:MAG: rod shape-determining protein RodA [Clostridiales bacterium]
MDMGEYRKVFFRLDYLLLLAVAVIIGIGLVVLNSASSHEAGNQVLKQIISICIGLVVFLISLNFEYNIFSKYYRQIYVFTILMLIAVLIFGHEAGGAKSWFKFPVIGTFQPSEVAKILLIISYAQFLEDRRGHLNTLWELIQAFMFFVPPVLLILMQPDMGSAMVFLAIMIGMLFMAGANWKWLLGIFGGGLVAGIGYIIGIWKFGWWSPLMKHQLNRFLVLFDSTIDRQGVGWNAWQAKIAIGNGGFFGQGIGSGTQSAGDFLPEQWTDFIFAVLCEELGFIGASVILIMFGVLLYRGIKIAMTSRDFYGSLVAIGVVTMFFFHVFENVGMNIGIMPIAGIPLPFISYGGSAVLANFMGIALLENIYMRRESLSFRE